MSRSPQMIGVDGGSTDPGPHYLGSGKCLNSRMAMKRDIQLMLRAARSANIPLVIGSCGGAGGEPHLQVVADIVREIAREDNLKFKLALIHSEQDKGWVKKQMRDGKVRALRNVPKLDDATVDRAERIVGMMGPEPFYRALDEGAQVILAGRSSDPAPWAACATRAQLPPAPAWYAGKMLECGATASWPKGHDCLLVDVLEDGIILEPTNPIRKCTPMSVANHSLHENASPVIHQEPGGVLDTTHCTFEAVSDRAVKVSGMEWRPDDVYTVKLEGAELIGYRAITICGTRDPGLIGQFDSFLDSVRENISYKAAAFGVKEDDYTLTFRVFGKNAVMNSREPVVNTQSHELGILVEVLAADQETANAVLAISRTNILHVDFPNRMCKEGNMAFPFSPSDIACGPAYRFSVFHVVEPGDALSRFPIDYENI
ncbi:MAG: acyclic terpene utilization AtuA family protein [Proteobacteria bacterium]|nr:acyclic terpene utilization AtuA family protein [Pseudomonadota bacterium]